MPARKPKTPPRPVVTLFRTTITSPFGEYDFRLEFTSELRDAWARHPGLAMRLVESSDRDDDTAVAYIEAVEVTLGTLTRTRGLPGGRSDSLGAGDVSMRAEPGEGFSEIVLGGKHERHPSSEWGSAVVKTFHSMVDALCSNEFPPASFPLHAKPPKCTAQAIVQSEPAYDGHELELHFLDDHWDDRALDVPRLCAALAAGETDDRDTDGFGWAVLLHNAAGTRLLRPLFMELTRVELAHLAEPLWRGERYWFVVDIDKKGCVNNATIRSDSKRWANESGSDLADTLFADRLSEESYGPLQWLLDTFARPDEPEDEGEEHDAQHNAETDLDVSDAGPAASSVPFPDDVRRFVESVKWTFAKTYAADWPHEYIVLGPRNAEMLHALACHVFDHGVEGNFYGTINKYHHEAGKVYWSMDPTAADTTLINRCDESQTYDARLAAGTLPTVTTQERRRK